jgi:transposase
MNKQLIIPSHYIYNYNAFQLSLPIDLGIKIDPNDEVVSFLKAMEGVNLKKYLKRDSCRGRKGYDHEMLLLVILFARMIGYSDLRSLEALCHHDIRFMYITQEEQPSHMVFQRFMDNYLINTIDQIFFEVSQHICDLMDIDQSIQYIDGTKIEANANKYTFVYKRRILNARENLFQKITESIILLNMETLFDFPYHHLYCAQEMGYIAQYLMEVMIQNNIIPVYGRGKRKSSIQKWYDLFLDYYIKLNEYEYWLDIIGDERNSCTKTDHDATMCATKMDYYCHTGLSRPCYNAQIAVSDGIIVNGDLFQRPADAKTFIPFMERYHDFTDIYPKYPMADAGYGTYDNYMYCVTHNMGLVMKYNMYAKKNEPKFKKKLFNPINWGIDENGYKICPNGKIFNHNLYDKYDERGENLRIIQIMSSEDRCKGCPFENDCCQNRNKQKTISRDVVLNQFYETVDDNLSSEFGKELKKQRSIQVEGTFGVIKQDMKFTRFTRRGLRNAKMEFLIVCLGYNLKKYHLYQLRHKKKALLN